MNEFEKKLIDYNVQNHQIRDILYSLASRYGIGEIRHGAIAFDDPNREWSGEIVDNHDSSVLFIANIFRVFNGDGETRVVGGHMIDTSRLNQYISIALNTGFVLNNMLTPIVAHRIIWCNAITSIVHIEPTSMSCGFMCYHRVKLKNGIQYA